MVLFETKSPSNLCLAPGVAFDKAHWSSIHDGLQSVLFVPTGVVRTCTRGPVVYTTLRELPIEGLTESPLKL
jgi:hypothetical protein